MFGFGVRFIIEKIAFIFRLYLVNIVYYDFPWKARTNEI